ncbi:hypothetical protein Sliba_61670 [Streptomyces nigrescens]|uniref:Uncharacterized protein n=1 Tax=Streptomyces nigrescens TaxID=1920 RepID=A0A640TR38_STRNI|nr:hypothetical protein Sliba_61670 [Streptomyces libani subsp. libani]GGV98829.1 hypothetical protein GCM10010500_48420 [Streptomyces libani subsp. libani]
MVDEIRAYIESVDDAVAASLGRVRMANGRRMELSLQELAQMVGAETDGRRDASRPADGDFR